MRAFFTIIFIHFLWLFWWKVSKAFAHDDTGMRSRMSLVNPHLRSFFYCWERMSRLHFSRSVKALRLHCVDEGIHA